MLYVTFSSNEHEPSRGETQLEGNLRPFKSGAEGYFLGGKIMIDDVQYQVSCNVVRTLSKVDAGASERREKVAAVQAEKAELRARLDALKNAHA